MLKAIVVFLYGFRAAAAVLAVGLALAMLISPHFLGFIFIGAATMMSVKIAAVATFAVVSAIKARVIKSVSFNWSRAK